MSIQLSLAGAAMLRPAAPRFGRIELKQAAEAKARTVQAAAQARSSPRMDAAAKAKSMARAKVMQIAERLKLLKSLYGQNPREMARALTQVFKELKAAVKAYRQAGGEEMGLAGAAVASGPNPPTTASASEATQTATSVGEAAEAQDGAEAGDPAASSVGAEPSTSPAAGYEAVAGEVRRMIGEEGLDFLKEVRGLTVKIKEMIHAVRVQTLIKPPEKATEEAFQDLGEEMKALDEEMKGMDADIRRAVPGVGMTLSVRV